MSDNTSKKWAYDDVRNADAETMKMLCEDAGRGDADAQYLLELLEREAKEKARREEILKTLRNVAEERRNGEIEKYRLAAKHGDAEAQYRLGLVYYESFHEQAEDDTLNGTVGLKICTQARSLA